MPWSTSDRKTRLPADWHKRRARTKRAAQGRCQHTNPDGTRCEWTSPPQGSGQPDGHADHIVNDAAGGTNEQANLQWLCPPHHHTKTAGEGNQAWRDILAKGQHPKEQHPALRNTPK